MKRECSKSGAPKIVSNTAYLLGNLGRDVSLLFIPHNEDGNAFKLKEQSSNLASLEVFLSWVGISLGYIHVFLLAKSDSALSTWLSSFNY